MYHACSHTLQLAEYMKVTLIEGRGILGSFDESLREYALKALKQGKVNMQFGASTNDYTPPILLYIAVPLTRTTAVCLRCARGHRPQHRPR